MRGLVRSAITFGLFFLLFGGVLFVGANWPAIKDKLGYWFGSDRFNQESIEGLGEQTELIPPDDRLVIPKLAINVPLLFPSTADEPAILQALQDGVAHYPGTSIPGERGNVFVTGHSSQLAWETGRYKNVFALLEQLAVDDPILVYYKQKKYIYRVSDSQKVNPDDTSVLASTDQPILTLMTCWPTGTTYKRLIVRASLQNPGAGAEPQNQAEPPTVLPAVR